MKKILLLILCVFMVGCQNNVTVDTSEQAEKLLTPPSVNLEKLYRIEQSYNVKESFDYEGDLILKVNDELQEEEEFYLVFGKHRLEAYYILDGIESAHQYFDVLVEEHGATALLFDEINGEGSEIPYSVLRGIQLKETHYFIENGKLVKWHYIEDDKRKGFIKDNPSFEYKKAKKHVFNGSNTSYTVEGSIELDNTLVANGYYIFMSEGQSTMVNELTGEALKANEFYISPDGLKALTVDDKLTLYDLLVNEFKVIYESEWTLGKPWQVAYLEDTISIMIKSDSFGSDFREFELNLKDKYTMTEKKFVQDNMFDVYPSRNINSVYNEKISIKDLEDVTPVKYVSLTPEGLKLWYEIPENRYVHIPINRLPSYDFVCDREGNQIRGKNGPIKMISSLEYVKSGIYLLEDGDETLVYDVNSNELMSLYKTIANYENLMVSHLKEDDKEYFIIFEYNNGFKEIYRQALNYEGDLFVKWVDINEFELSQMAFSKDLWLTVDYYDTYYDRFHMKRSNQSFENTTPPISETVEVYKTMEKTEAIGELKRTDIEFLNTYALIDNELVLWFRVGEYFAYRPLREGEMPIHSPQNPDYHMILEDGSQIDLKASEDTSYFKIKDDLIKEGYYTNYSSYEWYIGDFINVKSGQHFIVDGTPILSQDKKYLSAVEHIYGSDESLIHIYSFSSDKIERLTTIALGAWQPEDIIWESDTIKMNLKSQNGTVRTADITKSLESWTYTIHETN